MDLINATELYSEAWSKWKILCHICYYKYLHNRVKQACKCHASLSSDSFSFVPAKCQETHLFMISDLTHWLLSLPPLASCCRKGKVPGAEAPAPCPSVGLGAPLGSRVLGPGDTLDSAESRGPLRGARGGVFPMSEDARGEAAGGGRPAHPVASQSPPPVPTILLSTPSRPTTKPRGSKCKLTSGVIRAVHHFRSGRGGGFFLTTDWVGAGDRQGLIMWVIKGRTDGPGQDFFPGIPSNYLMDFRKSRVIK